MPMVTIPAGQVAAGHLPPVCARHGEQATAMKKVNLFSKPPAWAAVLIIAGVLPYLIVVMALRKTVKAPAWPWCAKCTAQRTRNLLIGLGLIVLAFVLIVVFASAQSDAAALGLLLAFVAFLAGIIVATRSSTQAVTGAFVSKDGNLVEVAKADERFAYVLSHPGARL
ncbi:hypothetical protein ACFFX1_42610 [Dactylosporangium sucinum]|uniref:Uncharacterized protein n=1 Tax=Dactylosporangium sucinum TaxID=1424081 RepID=A0A917X3W8_9ACTN|nr:hypothetical protein [Dactylosporangium sucinum]GGM62978.1 hypothetical protein GCM10007977_075710 [Dactylosporangium sucinum]